MLSPTSPVDLFYQPLIQADWLIVMKGINIPVFPPRGENGKVKTCRVSLSVCLSVSLPQIVQTEFLLSEANLQ